MKKHLLVRLEAVKKAIKRDSSNSYLLKKAAKEVKKYEKMGFEYFPLCENYDKKTGECLGHK
jgi:hypothetical protein